MKKTDVETIEINGEKFVKETELNKYNKAEELDGMKYCIVRTDRAGVFAGYVESQEGREVVIRKVRRIWYWSGAASLSQLAKEGTKDASNCKFTVENDSIKLLDAIEIIECTQEAKKNIQAVEEWRK